MDEENRCRHCRGTRQIDGKICPACDGGGVEPEYEDDDYRD